MQAGLLAQPRPQFRRPAPPTIRPCRNRGDLIPRHRSICQAIDKAEVAMRREIVLGTDGRLLDGLTALASTAAGAICAIARSGRNVRSKADHSPVTAADEA